MGRTNGQQPQNSLITPSASPPHRNTSSSVINLANIPSLSKNSISSGPSTRSGSRISSTPFLSSDAPDISTLRAQSTNRLLSVWSTLAERYSLRVDEDDIVDIRTGKLVKDRGVVRGLTGKWEFGRVFEEDEQLDESRVEGIEDGEEGSNDELDSFTHPDHRKEQSEDAANPFMALSNLTAQATRAIDPNNADDAADLRAFLEAERLRKEADDDAEEQDESSGEMEESSELVTDFYTETEAGFTSDGDDLQTGNENEGEEGEIEEKVRGITSDDDELEYWDNDDYVIRPSSSRSPSKSPRKSHLVTPPRSHSTFSEGYVDRTEPIIFSPPPSKTRSKSRARSSLPAAKQRDTLPTFAPSTSPSGSKPSTRPNSKRVTSLTSSKDPLDSIEMDSNATSRGTSEIHSSSSSPKAFPAGPISSLSSFPSSTSLTAPSKIPRIDLAQLSKQRRGRSQSRSPSKPAAVKIPSSQFNSSSAALTLKAGPSSRRKGKGETRANEMGEVKSKVADGKGKGKGKAPEPEVIEILDDSDESPTSHTSGGTGSRLSAKAKGKKRARSSGTSWSSADEDGNTGRERKVKPMGSPTKKGRYTPPSDEERGPFTGRASVSKIDSNPGVSASTSSSTRKTQHSREAMYTPTEKRQREESIPTSGRRKKPIYPRSMDTNASDDENDNNQDCQTFSRPQSRKRANSGGPVSLPRSNHHPHRSKSTFDNSNDHDGDENNTMHDLSSPSPSKSSPSFRHRTREYSQHPKSDSSLPPDMTAAQLQIIQGRAKHIISNAIEDLYSLLSMEGISALQNRGQASSVSSSSSQRPTPRRKSLPASSFSLRPDSRTDMTVYTPRKSSEPHRNSDPFDYDEPTSSSPPYSFPLSHPGSMPALYTTPTSHRGQARSSYTFDPNYSKGTLPPSSPVNSECEEYGHGDNDVDVDDNDRDGDEHDLRVDDLAPPTSFPRRRREHSRGSASQRHTQSQSSSPRPRASSIVQRSRSRGRRVSFKETAIQTQTRTGETRRTLSREISVEDPEEEVGESRRIQDTPMHYDSDGEEDGEGRGRIDDDEDDDDGARGSSRGRRIRTPFPRGRLRPPEPPERIDKVEVQPDSRRSTRRPPSKSVR